MNSRIALALLCSLLMPLIVPVPSSSSDMPTILSMRKRAQVRDAWLASRLDKVIPDLMRREGVDLWVLIAREYNEDPVVETMLPATWMSARRRTVLMFSDPGPEGTVERLAVSRYDVGENFTGAWDQSMEPDQWKRIAEIVAERSPKKIAVNISPTFALADGLSSSQAESFRSALPELYRERIITGERLAIGWLETRIPQELVVYPSICRIAHRIIAEGLSSKVIQPGVTTTSDVRWFYRERIRDLKLTAWFHPSVSIQRNEEVEGSFLSNFISKDRVILPGDLIHIDFGITYLGLNTDTQQHAYVLLPGEKDAPEGLRDGMKIGNRMQDILTANFVVGRSGNEVLSRSLARARSEGINPMVYTHPLGFHGHGAGPTIGLWDQQEGVPGRGDYELFPHTAYSIELNVAVKIPEWGNQEIRIMLEEDAIFTGDEVRYLDGRQTELILIP